MGEYLNVKNEMNAEFMAEMRSEYHEYGEYWIPTIGHLLTYCFPADRIPPSISAPSFRAYPQSRVIIDVKSQKQAYY